MSDYDDLDDSVFRVVKWVLVGALVIAVTGLFLAGLVVGSHG